MMRFVAYGHVNVLAAHPTTIEFTKEDFLTLKGDCILGIKATFEKPPWTTPVKLRITLRVDKLEDSFEATFNPGFTSTRAMVMRKSGYLDERTFAIHANKAAKDIKRELVQKLKHPHQQIMIEIADV